jgi:CspA family cold shock protein
MSLTGASFLRNAVCFSQALCVVRFRVKVVAMQGTVKWFNSTKKFGFIAPSDGGKDVFVHANEIQNPMKTLSDGERVEFEVTEGQKGPQATNVRAVS